MISMLDRCPGQYCGRTIFENGTWSLCGTCPRGFRVNDTFACAMCHSDLTLYSWYYLGFMAVLPLMLHCFFIDIDAKDRRFSKKQIILTVCAFIEVAISAVLSIFLMEPKWKFHLYACEIRKFSDWYTLFYNPIPYYDTRLHCSQEAVYPLQTIVLVYYFFCLVTLFVIRPTVSAIFDIRGKAPIYSALYFLPLLTFVHAMACGLIYYSFPYLSIIISMICNAIHYSLKLDQSFKGLLRSSIFEVKNLVVIIVHWLFLAYGIIALNQHYVLLVLIPFPSIFYIITVRCTDPSEFREAEIRSNLA